MSDKPAPPPKIPASDEHRALTPEAQRALAEAQARRAVAETANKENIHTTPKNAPKEIQGPKGLEPTRYGDWENKGIASDF